MNSSPVFSDFVHLPRLDDLTFACGLRTDADNGTAILKKLLPLSQITPGILIQRNIRTLEKPPEPECTRTECLLRRQKLSQHSTDNESLRKTLIDVKSKVQSTKNKIELTEKLIQLAQEKSKKLMLDSNETQDRCNSFENDIERGESHNAALKEKLEILRMEVENLKSQNDENRKTGDSIDAQKKQDKVVFARHSQKKRPSTVKERELIREVSHLSFQGDSDDSDDDN